MTSLSKKLKVGATLFQRIKAAKERSMFNITANIAIIGIVLFGLVLVLGLVVAVIEKPKASA